jgi:predicted lipoprotein with Yx(FWY)xxD motif
MRTTLPAIPLAALALVLGLAACGDDDDDATTVADQPAATAEPGDNEGADRPPKAEEAGADGTELVAAESQYGSILFDTDQRAIYLFDKEASDSSECYGACAEAWPPVLTEGEPQAGAGLDSELLGTTEREDGSTQVTYNGHPLYYYVDDPPGEVLCHNVDEFGGLWLVVAPGGEAVQ